jgi:serine/threonine-protein kinase HipA
MKRTIQVFLGDDTRRVGALHFDAVGSRQHSAFAYEDYWLKAADRFTLEPELPLVMGPQYPRKARHGSAFHAAIADTEPDGWAKRVILRDHATRRQEARRMTPEMSADSQPGGRSETGLRSFTCNASTCGDRGENPCDGFGTG